MKQLFQKSVVYILIASLVSLASPALVQAEIISTLAGIESAQREASLATINDVLARQQVRDQMRAFGVEEAQVEARLAALTDAELNQLAHEIETAPAGGVLEVIGIVFLVLLILEAVGVIDVFKKFP
jgi:hypothetical protein